MLPLVYLRMSETEKMRQGRKGNQQGVIMSHHGQLGLDTARELFGSGRSTTEHASELSTEVNKFQYIHVLFILG